MQISYVLVLFSSTDIIYFINAMCNPWENIVGKYITQFKKILTEQKFPENSKAFCRLPWTQRHFFQLESSFLVINF